VAKTTSGFNSDHAGRLYSRGLLLESPFVPSSTDCWAVRAKIRQKQPSWCRSGETGSRNMAATKKSTFWPWFPIHSFRQFLARTYRFATIQSVTDRWRPTTDRRQTDDTVYQRLDR